MSQKGLSSRLQQMKFMQRGKLKEVIQKKEEKTNEEDEHWIVDSSKHFSSSSKCVVVIEGDPKPGLVSGRFSFQSFNPDIEKINSESMGGTHDAKQSEYKMEDPRGKRRAGNAGGDSATDSDRGTNKKQKKDDSSPLVQGRNALPSPPSPTTHSTRAQPMMDVDRGSEEQHWKEEDTRRPNNNNNNAQTFPSSPDQSGQHGSSSKSNPSPTQPNGRGNLGGTHKNSGGGSRGSSWKENVKVSFASKPDWRHLRPGK